MTDHTSRNQATKVGISNKSNEASAQKVLTPKEVDDLAIKGLKDVAPGVISDLSLFPSALSVAKVKGQQTHGIEVTKDVYNYLTNNFPTDYIQYEGVRVYLEGTREACERMERLSMDAQATIRAEKWRLANPDKCL